MPTRTLGVSSLVLKQAELAVRSSLNQLLGSTAGDVVTVNAHTKRRSVDGEELFTYRCSLRPQGYPCGLSAEVKASVSGDRVRFSHVRYRDGLNLRLEPDLVPGLLAEVASHF